MRKLSDLIRENESTKKFKYNATVTIEGSVIAENEGAAGELIDKSMDTLPGMVNYEIISIEEDTAESFINPDLSVGPRVSEDMTTEDPKAVEAAKTIIEYINNTIFSTAFPLTNDQQKYIIDTVIDHCETIEYDLQ